LSILLASLCQHAFTLSGLGRIGLGFRQPHVFFCGIKIGEHNLGGVNQVVLDADGTRYRRDGVDGSASLFG
jgi:hypothetical protein